MTKDSHFYHTTIDYCTTATNCPCLRFRRKLASKCSLFLTVRIALPFCKNLSHTAQCTLIQLIQTYSTATLTGFLHSHLHSNGSLIHQVILLFNVLVTSKHIIFLGHNRTAGQVSSYVLSACALGSAVAPFSKESPSGPFHMLALQIERNGNPCKSLIPLRHALA